MPETLLNVIQRQLDAKTQSGVAVVIGPYFRHSIEEPLKTLPSILRRGPKVATDLALIETVDFLVAPVEQIKPEFTLLEEWRESLQLPWVSTHVKFNDGAAFDHGGKRYIRTLQNGVFWYDEYVEGAIEIPVYSISASDLAFRGVDSALEERVFDYGITYKMPASLAELAIQRSITVSCLPDRRIAEFLGVYMELLINGEIGEQEELENMRQYLTIPQVRALDRGEDPIIFDNPYLKSLLS